MKLTDWFYAEQKPEMVGVYQTQSHIQSSVYQFWNGKYWGLWELTPHQASKSRAWKSSRQIVRWRGLAEDPNGSKP